MTADDYAEAGVAPPPVYYEDNAGCPLRTCKEHGYCMYYRHPRCPHTAAADHPRCDGCGDETGECACGSD